MTFKNRWERLYNATVRNDVIHTILTSALNNAEDSAREGYFNEGSEEFFRFAWQSLRDNDSVHNGVAAYLTPQGKAWTAKRVCTALEKAGYKF